MLKISLAAALLMILANPVPADGSVTDIELLGKSARSMDDAPLQTFKK